MPTGSQTAPTRRPGSAAAAAHDDPAAAELLNGLDDDTIARAITAVRDLLRRWAEVPPGDTLPLTWPLGPKAAQHRRNATRSRSPRATG